MNAKAVEELERTNPLDDLPLPPSLAFERILGRIHAPRPAAILKFRPQSAFLPAVDDYFVLWNQQKNINKES